MDELELNQQLVDKKNENENLKNQLDELKNQIKNKQEYVKKNAFMAEEINKKNAHVLEGNKRNFSYEILKMEFINRFYKILKSRTKNTTEN